jgi:hypothetical protein
MSHSTSILRSTARKYKRTRQTLSVIKHTIPMIVFVDYHQRPPVSLEEFLEWLCTVNIEVEGNLVKVCLNNNHQ